MIFIDNAAGKLANLKNSPGVMQFAVFVDGNSNGFGDIRFRIGEFMYYEDAIAFAEVVGRRNLSYTRVAVERLR